MRTTLTLDPDVSERLKQRMRLGKQSLKEAVNDALRHGLGLKDETARQRFEVQVHESPFQSSVDVARLNQSVDDLEAESFGDRQTQ